MKEENKIIVYIVGGGQTKIDVNIEDETLWLTQDQMCELYNGAYSVNRFSCFQEHSSGLSIIRISSLLAGCGRNKSGG